MLFPSHSRPPKHAYKPLPLYRCILLTKSADVVCTVFPILPSPENSALMPYRRRSICWIRNWAKSPQLPWLSAAYLACKAGDRNCSFWEGGLVFGSCKGWVQPTPKLSGNAKAGNKELARRGESTKNCLKLDWEFLKSWCTSSWYFANRVNFSSV